MNQYTVKLFAAEAQAVGAREAVVTTDQASLTVARLVSLLAEAHPALTSLTPHCRLAVNHEFAAPDQTVTPNDEIALIGNVSGG